MAKASAGLLVYRRVNDTLEVLLVHPGGPFWANRDRGAWSIPKGEFSRQEDPLTAARREFRVEDVATDLSNVGHTEADIKFMQGMIGHHLQAIEMVALIAKNSQNEDLKKLGLRIQVSQEDEIKMMQSWLAARGQSVPPPHAMHMHGATLMPGMLSHEEMDALGKASGREFEKQFLEGMIKHHAGALTMVKELFATPGAGQDSEIYAFASDVEADQSMEIDRMRAMRQELEQQ